MRSRITALLASCRILDGDDPVDTATQPDSPPEIGSDTDVASPADTDLEPRPDTGVVPPAETDPTPPAEVDSGADIDSDTVPDPDFDTDLASETGEESGVDTGAPAPPDPDPPPPQAGRYAGQLALDRVAYAILDGDRQGQRVGAAVVAVGDTNADGHLDFVVASDCDRPAQMPTGENGCFKTLRAILGPLPPGRHRLAAVAASKFDFELTSQSRFRPDRARPAPDLTGDGLADFTYENTLFVGPFRGTVWGTVNLGSFETVLGVPDVTGDGRADLVTADGDGRVLVFSGPLSSAPRPADAHGTIFGPPEAEFGRSIVAGQFFLGAPSDLAIAAPLHDRGGWHSGAVFVFKGPLAGKITADDAFVMFYGTARDQSGHTLDSGDIKHNGLDEILVGGTFLTIPNNRGEFEDAERSLVAIHRRIWTEDCGVMQPARALGDIDGDYHEDFVVQNANHDQIELYYGPVTSFGAPDAVFTLPDANSPLCTAELEYAALGDLNGDSLADFAIGDPSGVGTVYVLLGRR